MTTEQANERLASDLKAIMRDAEELMKATTGQAGEKVTELRRLSSVRWQTDHLLVSTMTQPPSVTSRPDALQRRPGRALRLSLMTQHCLVDEA